MSNLKDSAEKIVEAEELSEAGDYNSAVATFTEAIALCTDTISLHPRLAVVAHEGRAFALDRLGRHGDSQRDLERARQLEELVPHHTWVRDQRQYQLTKTVSLASLDPAALTTLKQTGECSVTIPEALFDRDHPGHYMRRVRTIRLTISTSTGLDGGVRCGLSFVRGTVRSSASTAGGYARTGPEDPRFEDSNATQSVSAGAVRKTGGLLEADLARGLFPPFEGQGPAGSEWRIRLEGEADQLDLDTIADVTLHIRYTAREGGELLREASKGALR